MTGRKFDFFAPDRDLVLGPQSGVLTMCALEQIGDGMVVSDRQLAKAWIQRNEAEGYALFGDPAARLRLEEAA